MSLPWQLYIGPALIAVGALLTILGVRTELAAFRLSWRDPARSLVWVRGFRRWIVGFALVLLGTGLVAQQLWMIILALVIGGEEPLESSFIIFVLKDGAKLRLRV